MTKKQLKAEINNLESKFTILTNKISSLAGTVNSYQGKMDKIKQADELIAKRFDEMRDKQNNRWEILKEYLGVKEEEYAELKEDKFYVFGVERTFGTSPIKKTRLVKVKK